MEKFLSLPSRAMNFKRVPLREVSLMLLPRRLRCVIKRVLALVYAVLSKQAAEPNSTVKM